MADPTHVTRMFDRLDRICFDKYGSTDRRVVERVLDANPDLALEGIVLPMNLKIVLPDIDTGKADDTPVVRLLKLF